MPNGALEAKVTVPPPGWPVSLNDGGGADVATTPAGEYFPDEFFVATIAAWNAATGKTFTMSYDRREYGGGQTNITINTGTVAITWTSPDMRDYLGYTANLSGAAAYASPQAFRGAWLPSSPYDDGDGFDPSIAGHLLTDLRQSKGPTGRVTTWIGNDYRRFQTVRWPLVERMRAIDGINVTAISWQQFVRECQFGGLSYFPVTNGTAPTVRFWRDCGANTKVGEETGGDGEYALVLRPDCKLAQPAKGWTGLWTVEIPEVVKT